MPVTIPAVEATRPDELTRTATELRLKASALASQIDNQRATLDSLRTAWQGSASDAAIAKARPTLQRMQQMLATMSRAQTVLQQGGSELTQTRTNVLQTVSALSGQGWQIASDGAVSVRQGSPIDQYAKVSPVNAMKIQQLAATNSAIVKMQLAAFDTADRALSQNLRATVAGLEVRQKGSAPSGLRHRKRRRTTPVRRSPEARSPRRSISGGNRCPKKGENSFCTIGPTG